MLAELLTQQKDWIVSYHEHDSLLERRPEEDLSEEERKAAWEDYEREKKGLFNVRQFNAYQHMQQPAPLPSGFSLQQFQQPPSLPANPASTSSSEPGFGYHMAQLPRVVQEILKYVSRSVRLKCSYFNMVPGFSLQNPTISADELRQRLQAFLGMHTRFPRGSISVRLPRRHPR